MKVSSGEGRTIAVLSYFFLIGWIIAIILNTSNRTNLGSFHVGQAFGIMCLGALVFIIVGFLNIFILSLLAILTMFVVWLLGFISAIQGELQVVPVLGIHFQKWLKGI